MLQYFKQPLFFSLILCLLVYSNYSVSFAQDNLDNQSFDVAKYPFGSTTGEKEAVLQNFLSHENVALLLEPERQISLDQVATDLRTIIIEVKAHLRKNSSELKIILIDSQFRNTLDSLFRESSLEDKVYKHNPDVSWPENRVLVDRDQRLIVLYLGDNDSSLVRGNYKHSLNFFELENDVSLPGQLLFLRSNNFGAPDPSKTELAPDFADAFIDVWKSTGQVPNFVFLENIDFPRSIVDILNSTERIRGTIQFGTEESKVINWLGATNVLTSSSFSFPIYEGESISLTPQCPGFSFDPAQLDLSVSSVDPVLIVAKRRRLEEGVSAFFALDNGLENAIVKNPTVSNNGVEFVEDPVRGRVALVDTEAYAEISDIKDFKIVNENFTISTWIKLNESEEYDRIILSSIKNKYSEGLHVLIRDGKPYFAFFHNDLEGTTQLEANKWYNIVWRYRKELQQQSIYVNGELDTLANGRPPLRGVGNVVLGYRQTSSGNETYLDGYVDDIVVWNRALGDTEILNVFEGRLEIQQAAKSDYLWIVIVLLVIALTLVIVFKANLFTKEASESKPVVQGTRDRNAIFLFGGLKVLSKDGLDITSEITPKLKELFLLLYLSTLKDKKGITSEELSTSIWPDLSRQSAINNRGVSTTKLRQILSKLDGIELKYNNQFWTLEVADSVYSDYQEFLRLSDDSATEHVQQLTVILNKGNFLPNISKDWLDPFKFETSNRVIDLYGQLLKSTFEKEALDQLISYCDIILTFDVVHESAVKYKVAALKKQKKHEQALKQYQTFTKTYKQFYNEEFAIPFTLFNP